MHDLKQALRAYFAVGSAAPWETILIRVGVWFFILIHVFLLAVRPSWGIVVSLVALFSYYFLFLHGSKEERQAKRARDVLEELGNHPSWQSSDELSPEEKAMISKIIANSNSNKQRSRR